MNISPINLQTLTRKNPYVNKNSFASQPRFKANNYMDVFLIEQE